MLLCCWTANMFWSHPPYFDFHVLIDFPSITSSYFLSLPVPTTPVSFRHLFVYNITNKSGPQTSPSTLAFINCISCAVYSRITAESLQFFLGSALITQLGALLIRPELYGSVTLLLHFAAKFQSRLFRVWRIYAIRLATGVSTPLFQPIRGNTPHPPLTVAQATIQCSNTCVRVKMLLPAHARYNIHSLLFWCNSLLRLTILSSVPHLRHTATSKDTRHTLGGLWAHR